MSVKIAGCGRVGEDALVGKGSEASFTAHSMNWAVFIDTKQPSLLHAHKINWHSL